MYPYKAYTPREKISGPPGVGLVVFLARLLFLLRIGQVVEMLYYDVILPLILFFLFHLLAHSGAKLQNEPNKPSPESLGVLSANKTNAGTLAYMNMCMRAWYHSPG